MIFLRPNFLLKKWLTDFEVMFVIPNYQYKDNIIFGNHNNQTNLVLKFDAFNVYIFPNRKHQRSHN